MSNHYGQANSSLSANKVERCFFNFKSDFLAFKGFYILKLLTIRLLVFKMGQLL